MDIRPNYRPLCESFKFVPAKDMMLGIRGVCKLWKKIANSGEVLHALLDAEGIDVSSKIFADCKDVQMAFEVAFKEHKFLYTIRTRTVLGNFSKSLLLRISVLSGKIFTETVLDRHYCLLKLKTRKVFLCGGGNDVMCSPAACIYDISLKELQRLPNMRTGKTNCSLTEHQSFVYVFGGSKGYSNLTSADRFSLEKWEWEELPPLPVPVFKFSPSTYEDSIYLLAVEGWKGVLEYRPSTKEYHKHCAIGMDFDTGETDLTTFTRGDQWVLASKGTAVIVDLARPEEIPQKSSISCFAPLSPVLENREHVYLLAHVHTSVHLICLKLSTFETILLSPLSSSI